MKRVFLVFMMILILLLPSFAIDFSLSLEPFFGYTNGQLDEIIYRSKPKDNEIISLLEWEKHFFTYGIETDFSVANFSMTSKFSNSIHGGFGEMRDSDWLNTSQPNMKTTYSVGDTEALKNYNAEIELKYNFKFGSSFSITPIIHAQYSFDSFSRRKNAKGWYGHAFDAQGNPVSSDGKNHWWYEDEAKKYPTEYYWSDEKGDWTRGILAGIDYYRHSVYTFFGIGTSLTAFERLHFEFSFLISPFTYTSAKDTHHTAGDDNIFYQIQYGNFSRFKLEFGCDYDITKRIALAFSLTELIGTIDRGKLYYEDWYLNKLQPSGANVLELTVRFGIKIKVL